MTSSFMPIAGTSAGVDDTTTSSETQFVKVSASHVHTISGYYNSKSLVAPGEYISSSFTDAGHRWSIQYYPRGHDIEDSRYISLFLSCDDDTYVRATTSLCLLDKDGKVAYTCRCQLYVDIDIAGSSSQSLVLGVPRFISRKDLERSGHVRDDRLRVRFDISVMKVVQKEEEVDDAAVAAVAKFVDVPPTTKTDIFRGLGDLLSSGYGTDVMFEVDGESFVRAHRCILAARSPVFKAELFSPTKEGTDTCVWVEDMEPRVFKAMLHFVYNDVLPETIEEEGDDSMVMAQHLLVAADRYCLERMKLICEEKLCGYIDKGTVGTMLALADQHGCRGLEKACLNFLDSGGNLVAAALAGGLEQVLSSCPTVKELLFKSCSYKSNL